MTKHYKNGNSNNLRRREGDVRPPHKVPPKTGYFTPSHTSTKICQIKVLYLILHIANQSQADLILVQCDIFS